MDEPDLAVSQTMKDLCQKLLNTHQTVPEIYLFQDDVFKKVCKMLRIANEAQVIKDITFLIVASA